MLTNDRNKFSMNVSRRKLLEILGIAAGVGLTSRWGIGELLRASPPQTKAVFPKGAIIRTVLGDLSPDELGPGATLFHEHIASDTVDELVIEEINAAKKVGVGSIVDARGQVAANVENLRTISTRTGMHIVSCTAYYMQFAYPPDVLSKSEDQIADDLVEEIQKKGLGALGEIGQSPNSRALSPDELKVFRAVGKASVRTNLGVFTHDPYGTGPNVPKEAGLLQLDALESVGVKPQRVVVGHMCCLDDPKAEILKQVGKRGAFIGFDRMGNLHPTRPLPAPGTPLSKIAPLGMIDTPDDQRVREFMELLDTGYQDQLLLSDDATAQPLKISEEISQLMKDHWLTDEEGSQIKTTLYGAMGLGRTLSMFVPKLRKAGVREDTLHAILHDNPRRFLAFEPKVS